MNTNAILDIAALQRGFYGALSNTGTILPSIAIDMIKGNVPGGNQYIQPLIDGVFYSWKTSTILLGQKGRM